MIALYRKGDTHTIRGIQCEMQRFPNHQLHNMLNCGWSTSPEALKRKPRTKKEEIPEPEGADDAFEG